MEGAAGSGLAGALRRQAHPLMTHSSKPPSDKLTPAGRINVKHAILPSNLRIPILKLIPSLATDERLLMSLH